MFTDIRPSKREDDGPSESSSDSPVIESLHNLKHHDTLWFDDGNLVLIAHDIGFRLYQGLIVSQSTVLSNMLVSSHARADKILDGCLTVHLSDSPEDLAYFLRALLPVSQKGVLPSFYTRDASITPPFDELSAVIRLAHKYHVANIKIQALQMLHDYYFPSEFDRYERRRKARSLPPDSYGIAAINLARLTNTPSLLPNAFLRCSFLREAVLDGHKRADETVEHLTPEDLRRCLAGQFVLLERSSHSMASIFDYKHRSETCYDPNKCKIGLASYCISIVELGLIFGRDFIINWIEFIEMAGAERAICRECEKELQVRNARERRNIWDDLPKIFGITVEGWPNCGVVS